MIKWASVVVYFAWICAVSSEQDDCGGKLLCYDGLGCFPTGDPWTTVNRLLPAPQHPEKIGTKIYCYTRDYPRIRYNISMRPHEISLGGCPFRANRPTMAVTHGFLSDGKLPWLDELKDNYLESRDANVFVVNWGHGAEMLNYVQVSSNTRVVGAVIASFIRHLQKEHGMKAGDLHLIGHSLGAQVMSYAAKNITNTGHLTGLDPAQPLFEGADKTVRFDKTDAEFVEVIHTNGIPFVPFLGFGYVRPCGHVDFFCNGGRRQPGCEVKDVKDHLTDLQNIDLKTIVTYEVPSSTLACSHIRAYKYYTDALRSNCSLWGRRPSTTSAFLLGLESTNLPDLLAPWLPDHTEKCDADSCIRMGLDTPNYPARGVFVVDTPLDAPFCDDPETSKRIAQEISQPPSKEHHCDNNPAKAMAEGANGVLNCFKSGIRKFI